MPDRDELCDVCLEREREVSCDRCCDVLCARCSRVTVGGLTVCDDCYEPEVDDA